MSSGLYGLMEQAATKVLDRTTFADILTASVESIDPLTLTLDGNSLTITEDMLVLPEMYQPPNAELHVKDRVFVIASASRDLFYIVSPDPSVSRLEIPTNTGVADAIAETKAELEEEISLTADGKNSATRANVAPTVDDIEGRVSGDQWWQYDGSSVVGFYLFNGTTWVEQILSNQIIANLDAGKITTGVLDADRIASKSIDAGKIDTDSLAADSAFINSLVARHLATNSLPSRGVKIDDDAFKIYSNGGDLMGELSSEGELYLKSLRFDGGKIESSSGLIPKLSLDMAGAIQTKIDIYGLNSTLGRDIRLEHSDTLTSFAFRSDGQISSRVGNVWRQVPFAVYTTVVYMTDLEQNVMKTRDLIFPTDRFTQPPVITLSCESAVPDRISYGHSNVTTSGYSINVKRTDNVSGALIHVIALQMSP